jgi:hypothetical protein
VLALDLSAWDAQTWTAAAAWVTVAVYVGVLLFAWRQVREARRLREDQARPWVVVYFDVDWLTEIVVENIGKTVARDVHISFEPPLKSTLDPPWAWEDSTLLRDGIKTMAPSQKIRFTFDAVNDRFDCEELPLAYTASVSYQGMTHKRRRYTEPYVLDLGPYRGTRPPPAGLPEIADRLSKVLDEVKKWTDGVSGLRVNASNRDLSQRRQVRPFLFRATNQVRRQHGVRAALVHVARRMLRRYGWIR